MTLPLLFCQKPQVDNIQLLPTARGWWRGPWAGSCDSGRKSVRDLGVSEFRGKTKSRQLLPSGFQISWDVVRFGFGEGLFALLLRPMTLESPDLIST